MRHLSPTQVPHKESQPIPPTQLLSGTALSRRDFLRRIAITLPGCSLLECPFDRLTYRSENGWRELKIIATARSKITRGDITERAYILKGVLDGKPIYIVHQHIHSVSFNPGTQPMPHSAENLADPLLSGHKLRWRSNSPPSEPEPFFRERVPFRPRGLDSSGGFDLFVHSGPALGGWSVAECRGGARCPAGWVGPCTAPPPSPQADQRAEERARERQKARDDAAERPGVKILPTGPAVPPQSLESRHFERSP
jgi:hypothetical protein